MNNAEGLSGISLARLPLRRLRVCLAYLVGLPRDNPFHIRPERVIRYGIRLEASKHDPADGHFTGRVWFLIECATALRTINRNRLAAGERLRGVCRICGCSFCDPCCSKDSTLPPVCHWANKARTLCSECANIPAEKRPSGPYMVGRRVRVRPVIIPTSKALLRKPDWRCPGCGRKRNFGHLCRNRKCTHSIIKFEGCGFDE